MSDPTFATSMERLLEDTRAAVQRMQPHAATTPPTGGPASADPAASELLRAEATDSSERATAVVVTPGRIESLRIEPRLMREGSEAVCEAITGAVNAALSQLQDAALASAGTVDMAGLAVDLERLQADSLATASTMMASLRDAMDRISAPVERVRS